MSSAHRIAGALDHMRGRIEELERRHANFMRPGTVTATDYAKGLVKVKAGDLESGWVPWLERAAANGVTSWSPPAIGQQVHLMSPSGEPGQGWVMPGGFSSTNPQPSDEGGTHKIVAAKIVLVAETIELRGLVHAIGDDVVHNAKSIGDGHKHAGVTPGGAITDVPV